MSRSGYGDYYGDDVYANAADLYEANRERALNGRRGQQFLKELLAALDALPEPRLVRGVMVDRHDCGGVCALGAVGRARGLDMSKIDLLIEHGDGEGEDGTDVGVPVAELFGITQYVAREIMHVNDFKHWLDDGDLTETPEDRFARVRRWVVERIAP